MTKFNGFESYNLVTGLELLRNSYLETIKQAELNGKNSIFTEGYVNSIIDELKVKIVNNTKKDKFAKK
jgi:hypothetical protein